MKVGLLRIWRGVKCNVCMSLALRTHYKFTHAFLQRCIKKHWNLSVYECYVYSLNMNLYVQKMKTETVNPTE